LNLIFILSSGFWIEAFHQKKLYEYLYATFLIIFTATGALFLIGSFSVGQEFWISKEASNLFLPALVDQLDSRSYDTENIRVAVNYSLVSASAMVTTLILVFNVIVGRMFNVKLKTNLKKKADFMGRLSAWRASEWSLVPLLASFGIMLLLSDKLFDQNFNWLAWVGWNSIAVSIFPFLLGGLSLISYLLPRLPFLLLPIVLLIVIIPPPIVLAGVGLADVCFDVRKRLKDFSRRMKNEMDDDF